MIFIDVEIKSKLWKAEAKIEKKISKICEDLILLTEIKKILNKKITLELSISLVSNYQIKKINLEFRGKNKPTNVLSFPVLDENLIRKNGLQKTVGTCQHLFLGDIVIAYEKVKKESLAQKKNFYDHLTHLILHSLLHLIGYDHEDDKMAEIMESLEIKILKKIGIANPY